ncbi:MAG TPA: VCBS repeat-containing protein, partial [Candidatus Limnocylindria bacterium]|nr:VCBS repeat-containing protein [Candidatus Limnocylindria bacterium]
MAGAETGVEFGNRLSEQQASQNQVLLNGSGVAAGDVDGDGLCDLYFCALQGGNRLYRNLGNWKFADITSQAGVACTNQYSTGAVLADVDGDGKLDLLVTSLGGGTRCFLNDGTGHFAEKAGNGLVRKYGAMSMALADVDGDGDLDLYVANYRTTTIRSTGFSVLNVNGKRMIRPEDKDDLEYTPEGRVLESGEPDILYINQGSGQFVPVDWTSGAFAGQDGKPLSRAPRDWGLSAMFRDLNGDGAPDLYVCNDFHTVDRVWINDSKGHFAELPQLALRNTPTFSMSVDVADVNRDGFDDLLVTDMLDRSRGRRIRQSSGIMAALGDYEHSENRPQLGRNTLQLNRGDGTYAEIAYLTGLEASGWTWGAMFLDVDLDGYEDLLLTTGNLFDSQDIDANLRIDSHGPYRGTAIQRKLLMYPPVRQARQIYHNVGGERFEEVGREWGFGEEGVGHGMCVADLDNDGDLDVVVN